VTVFVFLGPTLSLKDASSELTATFLPPVAQGDVLRATRERPFAIGIVDGYFDRLPAVWHKEILWAMSQGVHVFGAASMGALRAAELAAFGMKGVGDIYEAFSSGQLEDDDEVAVAHGDESSGYRVTSEALVNIRATLRNAERAGVVGGQLSEQLVSLAKDLYYPDRSYPRLFERAREEGLPSQRIEAVQEFVRSSRVDQKRTDAIALLEAMRRCCDDGAPPPPARFTFAHTELWDSVIDWAASQPPLGHQKALAADLLSAEVRLMGIEGRALIAAGLKRAAATALARRRNVATPDRVLQRLDAEHRATLSEAAAGEPPPAHRLDQWLRENGLTSDTYRPFLERQAHLNSLHERYFDEVDPYVVDELRAKGTYPAVLEQARAKRELLARNGLEEPTLEDAGLNGQELVSWYCTKRLGCPAPRGLDLFLQQMGIPSAAAFQREALREFMYQRLSARRVRNASG
jgi:hypothetical protein